MEWADSGSSLDAPGARFQPGHYLAPARYAVLTLASPQIAMSHLSSGMGESSKMCSLLDRDLLLARLALPDAASLDVGAFLAPALRADRPVRPTGPGNKVSRNIEIGKMPRRLKGRWWGVLDLLLCWQEVSQPEPLQSDRVISVFDVFVLGLNDPIEVGIRFDSARDKRQIRDGGAALGATPQFFYVGFSAGTLTILG